MELLERAASAGLTRRVAAALPQHAVRTVSDGQVQYEMVSREEAAKLHDSFSSDGFAMVDETVLPDCSVEVGNNGQLLRLRIHGSHARACSGHRSRARRVRHQLRALSAAAHGSHREAFHS
jgi:hypothetical protein